MRAWSYIGLMVLGLASCQRELSDEQMKPILFNILLVDNLEPENQSLASANLELEQVKGDRTLLDSILRFYDVDKGDFLYTLSVLEADPRRLSAIYEALDKEVDQKIKQIEKAEQERLEMEKVIAMSVLEDVLPKLLDLEIKPFDAFYKNSKQRLMQRDTNLIKESVLRESNMSYNRLMYSLEHHYNDTVVLRKVYAQANIDTVR